MRVWSLASLPQIRNHGIKVVQQFFEPQFVGLVHKNKQQLIVMRGQRLRPLQLKQFRNFQIGAVGELPRLGRERRRDGGRGRRLIRSFFLFGLEPQELRRIPPQKFSLAVLR